jgi:hypothetical protein
MVLDKQQNQSVSGNSKALQGGRDAIDNSMTINYNSTILQEKKDFGIIEDIFNFLFKEKTGDLEITESTSGKGLKKIPLNFSGDGLQTINELAIKTTKKRELVKKFVNEQKESDGSKIDALVIKIQKEFRNLKNTDSHYEEIREVKIIETLAESCIDDSKKNNPDYYMNAIAIILYFFEMCDFGKSEEAEKIQQSIF